MIFIGCAYRKIREHIASPSDVRRVSGCHRRYGERLVRQLLLIRFGRGSILMLSFAPGEASKLLETVVALLSSWRGRIYQNRPYRCSRRRVVGDIAGFVRRYLREYAMSVFHNSACRVDSSVGGKMGVDLDEFPPRPYPRLCSATPIPFDTACRGVFRRLRLSYGVAARPRAFEMPEAADRGGIKTIRFDNSPLHRRKKYVEVTSVTGAFGGC